MMPPCDVEAFASLSEIFAQMPESDRVDAVRLMLIPLSSASGSVNELSPWDSKHKISRKR